MPAPAAISPATVTDMDSSDELQPFREAFVVPDGVIYLDGNSLGLLPVAAARRAREVIEKEWGGSAISGWNDHHWIDLPHKVGAKIAPLIGADEDEVVACDSTSANLFKVLAAALSLRPGRRTIVTNKGNFPTDVYIAEGLAAFAAQCCEVRYAEPSELAAALDDNVAAVSFTHVDYKSCRIEDMAGVTALAQKAGALAVWDLAHSAGAVPVSLNAAGADFAVGCGYKYLNGGPGAPAFLFAARRHHAQMTQPLTGWMGHATPFTFDYRYQPAPGIRRMLTGTPPVVALSVLEESVGLMLDAGIARLRDKGKQMTALMMALIERECAGHGLELGTPENAERRGNHVIYRHPEAYAIVQALKARGVVGDFRNPDCIRLGIAPIYLSYRNIFDAVQHLREVMNNREYERDSFRVLAAVT
jgi:kynureninase